MALRAVVQSPQSRLSPEYIRLEADDTLQNYIVRRVIQDQPLDTGGVYKVSRALLEFFGVATVAYGSFAYGVVTVSHAKDLCASKSCKIALSILACGGEVIKDLLFNLNASQNFIEKLTAPEDEEEGLLVDDNIPSCAKKTIFFLSIAGAALSQIPEGWGAYETAEKIPPLIAYWGGQLNLMSTMSSLHSSLLWATKLRQSQYFGFEAVICRAREFLCHLVETRRKALVIPDAARAALMRTAQALVEADEYNPDKLESFLRALIASPGIERRRRPFNPMVEDFLNFLPVPLVAALSLEKGAGAREAASTISNKNTFTIAAGSLVSLIGVNLIWTTVKKGLILVADWFRGESLPPITKEIAPRTYKTITYVGLALSGWSWINAMADAEQFPDKFYYPIGIPASIGSSMIGLASTHDFRDSLIKRLNSRHPLYLLDKRLQTFSNIIARIKPLQMAHFLLNLPEDVRAQISPLEITTGSLRDYIAGKIRAS